MSGTGGRVYIGTYTKKGSKGVYSATFDAERGTLGAPTLAGEGESPSFVAVHPNGQSLYAVGETAQFNGEKTGFVAAYHVDPRTGELSLVNRVASGGGAPCFVEVHPSGRVVLVANYTGGSVASFPVREDGSLGEAGSLVQHEGKGPDPKRQDAPHAHSIRVDPTGKFALAADLGLDRVIVYRLDSERATLTRHAEGATPPGAGPRLQAWHPSGRFLYVVNEMGGSVTAFDWDASAGTLTPRATVSTLPEGYEGRKSCAEVTAHRSGKFVYASNRGHDSIAIYAVDEATGALTWRGYVGSGGKEPRHFEIDPTGRWLLAANQNSDDVVLFRIDPAIGELTETDQRVHVSMPVCVRFA